jgi:NADH-quinone oxidoreductase subunit J
MENFGFYIFAFLTLLCGLLVVANPFSRNPVTSAMFLVLTIVSLAGLFVLLGAYFLAAVQIVVYAGAVMVLFLFVIMLLDLGQETRRKIKVAGLVLGGVSVAAFAALALKLVHESDLARHHGPAGFQGSAENLGRLLFTDFMAPFEVISIVLLVAVVGVILLSKRDLK